MNVIPYQADKAVSKHYRLYSEYCCKCTEQNVQSQTAPALSAHYVACANMFIILTAKYNETQSRYGADPRVYSLPMMKVILHDALMLWNVTEEFKQKLYGPFCTAFLHC